MNGNNAVSASFRNAGLPADLNALRKGMEQVAASASGAGAFDGRQLLKLDKGDGSWLYGAEGIEVEEGALIAVDPTSFQHGYILWEQSKVVAERMASVADPRPQGAGSEQLAFNAVIATGADKGVELIFKTTAHGGKEAVRNLIRQIVERMAQTDTIVPLVELKNESYRHKEYGRIWKPIFAVAQWAALTGTVAPKAEVEAEVEPAPAAPELEPQAPRRRRRTV
jgi:hypothetical protein